MNKAIIIFFIGIIFGLVANTVVHADAAHHLMISQVWRTQDFELIKIWDDEAKTDCYINNYPSHAATAISCIERK